MREAPSGSPLNVNFTNIEGWMNVLRLSTEAQSNGSQPPKAVATEGSQLQEARKETRDDLPDHQRKTIVARFDPMQHQRDSILRELGRVIQRRTSKIHIRARRILQVGFARAAGYFEAIGFFINRFGRRVVLPVGSLIMRAVSSRRIWIGTDWMDI